MDKKRHVGIIGAGASGISSAKYLMDAGLDVTLFEVGSSLGGVWVYDNDNGMSSAYASLHVNSERKNTCFRDRPFAPHVPIFPGHVHMREYLDDYATHHGIVPKIRFRTRVSYVEPIGNEDTGLAWRLHLDGGSTQDFDAIVVAAGHLSVPIDPPWSSEFTGEYLHSHYYRRPEPFDGKRVLVVGTGNSGCDITADIALRAGRAVWSARSPELIAPKLVMGVPLTDIAGALDKPWLPAKLPMLARNLLTYLVHGRMENIGLTSPGPGFVKHPSSHPTLVNLIAYQKVSVKPGIRSVAGQTVTFDDGSTEEFDTVIAATGYDVSYPFMPPEVLTFRNGGADLFLRVVPPDWPGLYFVGLCNAFGRSNLQTYEHQAEFVAAIESGQALLPTKSEMWREIKCRKESIAAIFPPGPRHALEVFPRTYWPEVKKETRRGKRRRAKLGDRVDRRSYSNRSAEVRVSEVVPQQRVEKSAIVAPNDLRSAAAAVADVK